MKNKLLATTLTTVAFLSAATVVSAEPNFSSCLNPQWSVDQVNYSSNAQHGVINVGSFAGTDTIYKSDANVLQCLCTPEGKGYQTNWMNAKNLSDAEIKIYQNQGWIYVTTGASYGLEDSVYLAKNNEYSCSESKVAGDSATNTSTSTAITTLAKTGNMAAIAGFFIAGAVFLALGFLFKKFSK